jgi:glycosyltransferase involved in cell wall biosynthesis
MRIVHILNHTYLYNGHVNVAVDLACTQARLGHQVVLVSQGGDFDDLLAAHQVEHVRIDQSRRPIVILKALFALHRLVRRFRPDIVHAHMMTSAVLAWAVRPLGRFKLVTTVHNEFEKSAVLMGLGDRVVAVSQAVSDKMALRGVRASKLRVVLNGVIGTPRLSAQEPEPEALERPSIVFVGGLHPRKGVEELIRAFQTVSSRLEKPHLYLVGSGPYRDAYVSLVEELGLASRVTFCGGQRDPRSYLLGADIFVLPSHAEPGGLVFVEARAAGCAIIATNVDGIPEMLDQGNAGVMVPPRDSAALADAMLKVLQDPALLAELRERARQHLPYFTVERVSRDYLAHFEELLSGVPAQLEPDLRFAHLP